MVSLKKTTLTISLHCCCSHKPKAAKLSKHLIALLTIGGVPQDYFLGLLKNTVQDAQKVSVDPRAAFRGI